ncbi:MAG: DUF6314 family protein [Alphaproteobacteria bacterium]
MEDDFAIFTLLKSTFQGKYSFVRYVSFLPQGWKGTAEFSEALVTARIPYQEKGFYFLGSEIQEFYQERFFQINEGGFIILKQDAMILHTFSTPHFSEKGIFYSHVHSCGADVYHCDFFIQTHQFQTFYTIQGPKKNFSIHTFYSVL